MADDTQTRKTHWLIIGGALGIVLILGVGLALDLRNHGRIWEFFWSKTGEETPLAQIRGMVEWAGNLTRMQPHTDPLAPINYADVNPYGINTFLQKEVEEPKMRVELQMIADAGFHWLRQEFPWEDLEVDGRGQFTDSRNDYDGDGQPDTIDAWIKYDRIVDLVEEYSLELQVRLSNPPEWTRANPDSGSFAPPDDFQDFVNYAVAVAERYKGRIHYYQVWNEPNGNAEWGLDREVNPEAYTDMLCRTYTALKAVDPDIVVISAALTPTVSLTGQNLSDFIYLQRMYDAGAGDCFDILSAQGYGLFSGPTDHRMRPTDINAARHEYIRDIMVANGDADKPIWISEAAWNPVAEPDVPRDIVGYSNYGEVTEEQAARYMPLLYRRAEEEWPWVGVINYWFFTRPDDSETNQAFFYFRMVEPDYQTYKPTFTPLPVYESMKDYIHNHTPVLYQGVHQAEDWAVTLPDDAQQVAVDGAQFGQAVDTSEVSFTAYGTDVMIRWHSDGTILSEVNGEFAGFDSVVDEEIRAADEHFGIHGIAMLLTGESVSPGSIPFNEDGWLRVRIAKSSIAARYEIHLSKLVYGEYDTTFQLDSITVLDRTFQNVYPIAGVGAAMGLFALWVIASALRARFKN